jgi:hypothetical protein
VRVGVPGVDAQWRQKGKQPEDRKSVEFHSFTPVLPGVSRKRMLINLRKSKGGCALSRLRDRVHPPQRLARSLCAVRLVLDDGRE